LFKKTKTGYRYSPILIVGGSFVLSIVLGTLLFFAGGGEKLEQKFADKVSFYESIEEKKIKRWSMPEKGFLSGIIIKKEENIIIEDLNGKQWEIDFSEAEVKKRLSLKKDEKIKIIGKILEDNIFVAEEIRPWKGRMRQGRRQNNEIHD